eukprot:TRINITY_DN6197_c0_g1_i2.p1 TRINITY_DN6197_c0_g1~~TRINITY_DN6197_c0_g1_i2.p1  ORF type:complete len:505 (+),score=94.57 TRINITY_DN6197_c0_g1_i2:190-1704(+)
MAQQTPIPLGFYVILVLVFGIIITGFLMHTDFDSTNVSFTNLQRNCPVRSPVFPHYYTGCGIKCNSGEETRIASFSIPNPELYALIDTTRDTLAETGPLDQISTPHLTLGYYCCLDKHDMRIVHHAIKQYPWREQNLTVSLTKTATCHTITAAEASIYLSVVDEDQAKLARIQDAIEATAIANGARLKVHRRDMEPFHITLATVLEDEYNMHWGLKQLNTWLLGNEKTVDGLKLDLTSPCWRHHDLSVEEKTSSCLSGDYVENYDRNRRLGRRQEVDGRSRFSSTWMAYDWGRQGITFYIVVTFLVHTAVALSVARSVTPLTRGLLVMMASIALLSLLAWICYKSNLDSIKQLALYLTSACTDTANMIIYYYLHRSSRSERAINPTLVFLVYFVCFVADYTLNFQHAITWCQGAVALVTLHVINLIHAKRDEAKSVTLSLQAMEAMLLLVRVGSIAGRLLEAQKPLPWALQLAGLVLVAMKTQLVSLHLNDMYVSRLPKTEGSA